MFVLYKRTIDPDDADKYEIYESSLWVDLDKVKRLVLRELKKPENREAQYFVVERRVGKMSHLREHEDWLARAFYHTGLEKPYWEVDEDIPRLKLSNRERLAYDILNGDKIALDAARDILGVQDL